MLTLEQLEQLVMTHIDLVEVDRNAMSEARERAAKFLVVQAHLANHLKLLDDTKVKASTIEKAQYSQSLMSQNGKNVTENKINAEADPRYAASRESVELVDAERDWVKRHYEIFGNAHVMFRQISVQNGV
jgi:hypothetical protein